MRRVLRHLRTDDFPGAPPGHSLGDPLRWERGRVRPPASFLIKNYTKKVQELPRALRSCGAFFLQDFARQKRTLLCPKHNFDKRISLATPIAAGAETLLPPLHLVGASVSHCDRGEAGVNWNSPQPLS